MNDDRLARALAALREIRLSDAADRSVRARLEERWPAAMMAGQRARPGRRGLLRRFAPALASAVIILGVATVALGSPANSPLYGLRVALEDLAVPLHLDLDDRAAYVLELAAQRDAEAQRFESSGNAAAARVARDAEADALRILQQLLPTAAQEPPPSPSPAATPPLTPSPTVTPTPSPSLTPTPAPPPATRAPTPVATPTPKPPTPKPSPTPTPLAVSVTGVVHFPDGSNASEVCISTAPGGSCFAHSASGSFGFTVSAKINQTLTLYFQVTDASRGGTFKAAVTFTVTGPQASLGVITLQR